MAAVSGIHHGSPSSHSSYTGSLDSSGSPSTSGSSSSSSCSGGGSGLWGRSIRLGRLATSQKDCTAVSDSSAISDSSTEIQIKQADVILAYLLRLACVPKGILGSDLTDVALELCNLGIASERVADLVSQSSSLFERKFIQAFEYNAEASKIPQFWKNASRYLNDFEEIESLGRGGFGHVVLCKNKLDGVVYAVKIIRVKDKSKPSDDRTLREVSIHSRLQHPHVVRYHQAWFEVGYAGSYGCPSSSSSAATNSSDQSSPNAAWQENHLYIQMEYCPRTLRQKFDCGRQIDKKLAWHLFRQIVEGLAHIHGQGIIHHDLTPDNIFLDAYNNIKIGDFGLAKFLKLEEDGDPARTTGVSVTVDEVCVEGGVSVDGAHGTYFYSAPEIKQHLPKINEKADIYSLGILFFELWHPFTTGMERTIVLSDLIKGDVPLRWADEFPKQASLLHRMISSSPSIRPSATQLFELAFSQRLDSKSLNEENGELPTQSLNATPTDVVAKTDAAPDDAEEVNDIYAEVAINTPAKPKYRYQFYQKPEEAFVDIFAKGLPADRVSVNFGEQILTVTVALPGEEAYVFQTRLFGKIIPAKCRYVVLKSKIEIHLAKVEPIHWTSLEFTNTLRSSNASSDGVK